MSAQAKVWFVTGASSGFGHALAEAVLARGEKAVLAARRQGAMETLQAKHPAQALAVSLDVTESASRKAAVAAAIERFGRIDVLANIAGRGSLGAAEEFSEAELRAQLDVNFVGAVELTRLVLPQMRAQGSGHVLNLTSVGGVASAGGFSAYCASKFALEGWSEALRDEVAPFGISVTLVEPGNFRTEFAGEVNLRPAKTLDVYRPQIAPIETFLFGQAGEQPGDPAKAANLMIEVVQSQAPPLRILMGSDAYAMWDAKRDVREADYARWRERGLATAFEDAKVRPIPVGA